MRLKLKDLIKNLLNHTHYTIVSVQKTGVSIAAGSTLWVTVDAPTGKLPIALCGWYITGWSSKPVLPYACYMPTTGDNALFALWNQQTTAASVTITVYFLCVDK